MSAAKAPTLTVIRIEAYERDIRLRLPFRFGVVTLREAPQAYVRVRIRLADGREGWGLAAELLAPKWFDKNTALSNEDNFAQLRRSLAIAAELQRGADPGSAFARHAAIEPEQHRRCAAEGLNGLIASFGLALLDRAVIDALCRLERLDVFTAVRQNRLGITAATAPDLADFDLDAFLGTLAPASAIRARHTVGLVDALTRAEIAPEARRGDGLPESLEEAIDAYGHRDFKLKVGGQLDADLDRLSRIAAVLDRIPGGYRATLDGNEQYESAEAAAALLERITREPRLARLWDAILFVEQPIARSRALEAPVDVLARLKPVEIDESDASMDAFRQARGLGYTGISSKSCKGFYRALLNRARATAWNAEEGHVTYFMSAEDLTTQPGIAVQQDLALATLIGCDHVERNGHHYVDGFAGAPESEQQAFLAAHPDLYHRQDGRVRLAIRDGTIAIASLATPGLGVGAEPDWSSLRPLEWESA
ncbi:MAG: mandelate racemase [Pseudomonadota bacterium]|nr:mandelate racemase [Pseudomonadota bacterium]